MKKIQMSTPLVEMDGDEMTRILWQQIKEELLLPYVELKTVYFDLGLPEREKTADRVTVEAAEATKQYGVAVKCATITPNQQRVEEYQLTEMWKSPNGTIRSILDGTVFRAPIMVRGVSPVVKTWKKPITIARHAYGDVYKATEYRVPGPGVAELVFAGADGRDFRQTIYEFECAGVLQGQFNKDSSIVSFARSCFQYAVDTRQDLWFSTKDTISKKYDHTFKDIFQEIFEKEYQARFEALGITYFYTLIDDAVARVIRSKGGFIWACKNYDGDVMSDMVSTAFGSLVALAALIVALGFIIKHLTKNNPMVWTICIALYAAMLIAYWVDHTKFEGLLPIIMTTLSLFERFYVFVNGVFDVTGIVYYLTVIVFFLFLSVQSLEKRRYN